MKGLELVRRATPAVMGLLCCGLLGACGAAGTQGFEPARQTPSVLSKLGNLVAFNKLFPDSAPLPQSDTNVDCPVIEVQDGTASVRVFKGGQSNADVRYGFSMGDVARECSKVGNQLQLKVGVEGRVLIGPAGAPGTFTVPIRIAVRNDNTQKVLSSQLARISATIAPSDTQAGFTYVTEPFSVPFVGRPEEDYTILVGFDSGAKSSTDAPARSARRKPRG